MSGKPARVSAASGMMALVIVLAVLILGYSAYLIENGKALDFQAEMLEPSPFIFRPLVVMQLISAGGYLGTVVAVALKVVHSIFAVAIVFTLSTILFSRLGYAKATLQSTIESKTDLRKQEFECRIAGSDMLVSVPPNMNHRTGEPIPGINDTNPYNQRFFRIDARPLKLVRQPESAIEKIQISILEMLAAHADVPASIGNHHADATLMEHSKDISKKVKAVMARMGRHDDLAGLVGLAHDLDKLLAYRKKGDGWIKNGKATHHNTYSAYIVQHLEAFNELPPEDQNVLVLVLRYYHHPDQLPLNAGERVEHLIQALREADGWGIRSERSNAIAAAKDNPTTASILSDGLSQFFADADINRYKGGSKADGWTVNAVEFVIVPASTVLEGLHKFLPAELTRQLQLGVDTRIFGHPAIEIITDTLRGMGLLMEEYKDMKTTTGLFDVKVGMMRFSACFLLDKMSLVKLIPTTVPKWGMSEYGLRVRKPTSSNPAEDEPDD